jgi:hypothetical protein
MCGISAHYTIAAVILEYAKSFYIDGYIGVESEQAA